MSDKAKNYTRSLMSGQESTPYDSTYTIVKGIYNQIGGTPRDFDSTYSIVLAILEGLESGTISPGSQVSIDDTLATGSLIAVLTIDGTETPIYIPAGAAGSGSFVTFTQIQSSGSKIAEIAIDGISTDIYAPEVDLSGYATTSSVIQLSESVSQSISGVAEWGLQLSQSVVEGFNIVWNQYATTQSVEDVSSSLRSSIDQVSSSFASTIPSGSYSQETWTFTLTDSSSVNKVVLVG